jgi:hypothetical protein
MLGGYIYISGTAGATSLIALLNNNAAAQQEVSSSSQFWIYNGKQGKTCTKHVNTLMRTFNVLSLPLVLLFRIASLHLWPTPLFLYSLLSSLFCLQEIPVFVQLA